MNEWSRMPSYWIRDTAELPLKKLKWKGNAKSDQIADLMIYIVLVHHANTEVTMDKDKVGLCSLTYSELSEITGVSRAKVSGGLKVLIELGVISQIGEGRNNCYQLHNFIVKGSGWAKLPAKGLYSADRKTIPTFHDFHLRSRVELDALKLYLLIVSFRNNENNYAVISYDKIEEYTGIPRNQIKPASSLLVTQRLIHVDSGVSQLNDRYMKNMYRLRYLDPYKHRGTNVRDISTINN